MSHIKNLENLVLKLNNISKPQLDKCLTEACLMVERDAKLIAPAQTGELRQSITHEVEGTVGAVGSNLEYAPYVHQGTGIYAIDGQGRKERWSYQDAEGNWHSTIGQHPQPFLTKALASNRDDIIKLFEKYIKESAK